MSIKYWSLSPCAVFWLCDEKVTAAQQHSILTEAQHSFTIVMYDILLAIEEELIFSPVLPCASCAASAVFGIAHNIKLRQEIF